METFWRKSPVSKAVLTAKNTEKVKTECKVKIENNEEDQKEIPICIEKTAVVELWET